MNEFRSPKDMATPTSKAGRRNGTFHSVAVVEGDGAYHEGFGTKGIASMVERRERGAHIRRAATAP